MNHDEYIITVRYDADSGTVLVSDGQEELMLADLSDISLLICELQYYYVEMRSRNA